MRHFERLLESGNAPVAKNSIIIYHSGDYDGWGSWAAIASRIGWDAERWGIDYGPSFPTEEEMLEQVRGKHVYMADVSCDPELMLKIREEAEEFVWIDHHISAIKDSEEHGYDDLPGIREDGTAAQRLCWRHFHDDEEPAVLTLLGKYDVFDQDDEWETKVLPVQFWAVANEDTFNPETAGSVSAWEKLLATKEDEIGTVIGIGSVVLRFFRSEAKKVASSAHVAVIDGVRLLAINTKGKGSMMFDSLEPHIHETKGMLIYNTDGENWGFGAYGWDDSPDLSEIASKFGGGGHAHACGFRMTNEEFLKSVKIEPCECGCAEDEPEAEEAEPLEEAEHPYGVVCAVCEGKIVGRNRGEQPHYRCLNEHICDDAKDPVTKELTRYTGSMRLGGKDPVTMEDAIARYRA